MDDYVLNKVSFEYDGLEEAFPDVDPGVEPFGSRVLVQLKRSKSVTKGGIILTTDVKHTEQWNTQVAKVIKVGDLAFKNRNTMEFWPEGSWVKPGDYVRVPKYGGDRWTVSIGDGDDNEIHFLVFNDLDLIGQVTGNPLSMKAYV